MAGFKPNAFTTAKLIAKAENDNADEYLDYLNRLHDAHNGTCPGECCPPNS